MAKTIYIVRQWTTGERIKPEGQAGWFSADNYGDFYTIAEDDEDTTILVDRASRFVPTIESFSVQKWRDIFNRARQVHKDTDTELKRKRRPPPGGFGKDPKVSIRGKAPVVLESDSEAAEEEERLSRGVVAAPPIAAV